METTFYFAHIITSAIQQAHAGHTMLTVILSIASLGLIVPTYYGELNYPFSLFVDLPMFADLMGVH